MATYYLWSGATGAATGADWANAVTTLVAATALATASGDLVKVHKTHQETTTGSSFTATNISLLCVDKDAADVAAEMGGAGWFESSTSFGLGASGNLYIYGCTFSTSSAVNRTLIIGSLEGSQVTAEKCRFKLGASGTGAVRLLGQGSNDRATAVVLRGGSIVFGSSGAYIDLVSRWYIEGVSFEIAPSGSIPTALFRRGQTDPGGSTALLVGCDLSVLGTSMLVDSANNLAVTADFVSCKLGSGYVALNPTLSLNNLSAPVVTLVDCATDDTHGLYEYHNALGSLVIDAGVYFTGSASGKSWRITTKAQANPTTPFQTPWLSWFHTPSGAITPRLEILRDGSSTAYTDAEVWSEWSAKVTSGTVLSTFYSDRQSLTDFAAGTAGTAQAAGAGLGSWTGESGTAWSGKLESPSFTPAEVGDTLARVCVAVPSATVYVDPEPRT